MALRLLLPALCLAVLALAGGCAGDYVTDGGGISIPTPPPFDASSNSSQITKVMRSGGGYTNGNTLTYELYHTIFKTGEYFLSVNWDFGAGLSPRTSTKVQPTVTVAGTPGKTYTAKVTLTTSLGSDTFSWNYTVQGSSTGGGNTGGGNTGGGNTGGGNTGSDDWRDADIRIPSGHTSVKISFLDQFTYSDDRNLNVTITVANSSPWSGKVYPDAGNNPTSTISNLTPGRVYSIVVRVNGVDKPDFFGFMGWDDQIKLRYGNDFHEYGTELFKLSPGQQTTITFAVVPD